MNSFNFIKLFLVIALLPVLSSCSLELKPPVIPSSSETIENPIIDKNYIKHNTGLVEEIAKQSSVKKLENWEELKDFLKNNFSSTESGLDNIKLKSQTLELASALSLNQTAGKDSVVPGYSKTNVQAKGVDEVNSLKTDGHYIYALKSKSIFIINAYPGESAKPLSEIKFKSQPRDFFITNNRLSVFGSSNIADREISKKGNYSYVKIFDTSNKSDPKEIRNLDIEGNYINARLIGDHIYFISSMDSFVYRNNSPMLPEILENNQSINCTDLNKCVIPKIYYFDMPYSAYNLMSISSINIKNIEEKVEREFYILPKSQNIFISDNNLYIAYKKYLNKYYIETEIMTDLISPNLSEQSKQKIKAINLAGDFILTRDEKQNKIRAILEDYIYSLDTPGQKVFQKDIEQKMVEKYQEIAKELEKTIIHKINLDKDGTKYQGFGEVSGQILNQSSMSEKDGNLFVVTTESQAWSAYVEKENKSIINLYALDTNLKIIGELEGLAKGEQIHSVRFMQGRVYMATFKKADPLFVVDTSSPKELKILGKLKISGLPNYLYPYDNNTLIVLGRETTESEAGLIVNNGVELSLFDVSDVQNPQKIDSQILGGEGSDSIALDDHKAFLFVKNKNLLVLPVSIKNSKRGIFGNQDFDGVILFNVNTQSFSLKGLIDNNGIEPPSPGGKSMLKSDYRQDAERSLCINDTIYTISDYGIKLSSLKDLSILGSFSFVSDTKDAKDDHIINAY